MIFCDNIAISCFEYKIKYCLILNYIYIKDKRKSFPRFYFLSDEDLLEMIGQTKKISVVQSHLKKLFSGVQNVQFDSSGNITAIESPQNEIVILDKPVQVSNQIEVLKIIFNFTFCKNHFTKLFYVLN